MPPRLRGSLESKVALFKPGGPNSSIHSMHLLLQSCLEGFVEVYLSE